MGEIVQKKLEELSRRRREVHAGGGPERIEKIHATGRLTARERVHDGSNRDVLPSAGGRRSDPHDLHRAWWESATDRKSTRLNSSH